MVPLAATHAAAPAIPAVPAAAAVSTGEEDTFEWTEEEQEEGPEQLSVLEADTDVDGAAAWTPLFSSSNDQVKNQVCVA